MKRLIVVDVSNFIFRAFFAIRPLSAPDGTPVNAVYGVLSMFLKLMSQYRPTHILMARDTSGGSFRNEMYDQYKANRSEPPEDLIPQFSLIKELITKMELPSVENEKYEADDLIGSAVCQWREDFDEILIASGDKDLMQFVGGNIKMLDTMKDKIYDEKAVVEKMGVRPDQIIDYLSMVGDSSDNIPGMRGIGAKGAAKLLAEHDTLDKCIEVKDSFTGKKLTTAFSEHLEEGLLSRDLIKIVTDIDLDIKSEDVEVKFYPSEELITFLQDLGFKNQINKLNDLKKAEHDAEESNNKFSSLALSFNAKLIKNKKEIEAVVEVLSSCESVAVHTEYNSGDIFNRELSLIALSVDGELSYILNIDGKENQREDAIRLLEKAWGDSDLEVSSEHWKRDTFFALENSIDIKCRKFDTSQAHYIVDPGSRHDFATLAKTYFDHTILPRNKKDPYLSEMDIEDKVQFTSERACLTFRLFNILKSELTEKDLTSIYTELDEPMFSILSKMERRGVSLDKSFLANMEGELEEAIGNIEAEVHQLNDGDEINLKSPKQVGELLFGKLELPVIKKTKTGFSTDSDVLETLDSKGLSPIPGLILKHRELGKLLSTYIKTLPLLVHEKDKRLHTHFNQHVAATGRLSSNNPNLQNIPIRTPLGRKIRKAFVAEKGNVLLGADYSQVELRLLAHLSGDPIMLEAFKNGEDIHKQTASEIMGVPLDKVTSEERSKAKAVNFGLMYGQSSFGLAAQLKISRKEAKEYITSYFERFERVKSYLDSLKEKAEKNGYAETMMGRKRFLPDIYSKNRTVKSMAERVAINSPIQGTAADIIKLAMIKIDMEIQSKNLSAKCILQVHDELIFEVPKGELEEMQVIVKNGMESVVSLEVPLLVDMGTGENWYDLK